MISDLAYLKQLFKVIILLLIACYQSLGLSVKDSVVIDTDRPGISYASSTVAENHLLVEYGFTFMQQTAQLNLEFQEIEYSNFLVRYGVIKGLEMRLLSAYSSQLLQDGNSVDENGWQYGLKPFVVGAKINLGIFSDALLHNILLVDYQLPKERGYFSSAQNAVRLTYGATYFLSDNWNLSYNLGYDFNQNSTNQLRYTLKVGALLNDDVSTFIEFYGSKAQSFTAINNVDAGLIYLVSPQFQLDLSAGLDIVRIYNEVLPYRQSFISIGASYLLSLKR